MQPFRVYRTLRSAPVPMRLLSGTFPAPADPALAKQGLEHWAEAAAEADATNARFARSLAADDRGRALLEAVFGNSPYLSHLLITEMGFARRLIDSGPDAAFAEVVKGPQPEADGPALMRRLRVAKRRAALAAALSDIAGVWTLEKVTRGLSDFADVAHRLAVRHLLAAARERGDVAGGEPDPARGYFILGMGKLGSRELNYSSDVDLIALYDPERIEYAGSRSLQHLMIQITRDLVRILEERTEDGYVFRCDLRLRPDPGATPLAVSVDAAEAYYEGMGQNWERAAMIKARYVAGDQKAGEAFLKVLVPYIWRKHLDFAAIADIHSIKRQIHAHHGGATIRIPGHNVKLGRGGIREIEFYAQTQQLIWGGRMPQLRKPGTVDAIAALEATGRVTLEAAYQLTEAYRFLRRVEHRLQMIEDQQVHTLPEDVAGLNALAVFLGFRDGEEFSAVLLEHLRNVERNYAALFEEAPSLTAPLGIPGNLVFTGIEHDPDTLKTLERLGFADPPVISAAIMAWHRGRYPAMRSARAREILTELVPAILSAFAKTASPQAAFMKFDEFLSRLPAGVQLFSLFQANPALLAIVAEVMGDAPYLADILARRPILLDGVLSADFFEPLPDLPAIEHELSETVAQAQSFEGVLDLVRRWAGDKKFRVGVHLLRNLIPAETAGANFSDIAEAAIRVLKPAVEAEFAEDQGPMPGGMAVVAMGRLGGRDMTLGSDLDLIFVYDTGARGADDVTGHEYFSRLSRRLINAITAQTAEGPLYSVDMRLRPSGSSGPIASSLAAFRSYQSNSAWTWEHLALTRARFIAGPPALASAIGEIVREVLTRKRDPGRLAREVLDMRLKIAQTYKAHSLLDIKHLRGGFVDADFIVQFLQLRFGNARPEILAQNTLEALARVAEAGLIAADTAHTLHEALRLWQRLLAILRLCYPEPFPQPMTEDDAPEGLRRLLTRATATADYDALKRDIQSWAGRVRAIFEDLIEKTAAPAEEKTEGL